MAGYSLLSLRVLVLLCGLLQVIRGLTTTTVAPPAPVYCYTCKSWEEDRCTDPYNKESLTPEWCDSRVCFKIIIDSAPDGIPEGTERGCWLDGTPPRCEAYQGPSGASGDVCYCTGDRCNIAPTSLLASSMATIAGAVLISAAVKMLTL